MDTSENTTLPNAADRLALKGLVPALIQACPDMYELACSVARDILTKHGVTHLEPEQVYWHRFKWSASRWQAFTGWEHHGAKPIESMTLPQLVIQRFRVGDQDNADMLDVDGGFYTAGPEVEDFDETNEVRMHGNEVLKDFWAINFADLFDQKVAAFWNKHSKTFRTLAKCTFLAKAMEDREGGRLSDDNFRTVIKAVAGNVSWPVTLQMLEAQVPPVEGLRISLLKVGGYVATDILCINDGHNQILYAPGEVWGLHAFQSYRDLHWWVLSQTRQQADRKRFLAHFQVADHDIMEDTSWRAVAKRKWLWAFGPAVGLISTLWRAPHIENVGLNHVLDLLVSTWDSDDHSLIEHTSEALDEDAFNFLASAAHTRMISDATFMMHTNGDLRKKLWLGYLNAFGRMFGPMSAVGWPVALAVVGSGIASVGLQIDQAINGKTPSDRRAAVTGAIFATIDTLFNATFIKGSGRLPEIAEAQAFFVPEEKLAEAATARPPLPTLEDIAPARVLPAEPEDFLASFKTEITEGTRVEAGDPRLQEIIQTASGKHYIFMRRAGSGGYYQVRYVEQLRGWVIIDPANPFSFYRNVPVRLNEALRWEPVARTGLKGGVKIFGKWPWGHTVDPLPEVDIQPLAYDVPSASRPALQPLAEADVDAFPLDPQDSSDRFYQDFKAARRTLYDNAITFYATPELPPRPLVPAFKPSTPFAQMTKRLFQENPGLVIGQDSAGTGARQLLIDNLKVLNKQKIRTLYMDHLLTDFHQADLDVFHNTGKMPPALERYLKVLDIRFKTDPTGPYSYTELVKTAQKNHIRVQAIDSMASRRFPQMEGTTEASSRKMMNYYSDTILRTDQVARGAHRWVALVDEGRASTFEKAAGLSELEGAVALRVDESALGQAQGLTVDPGKKVKDVLGFTFDELKSDLRLQLKAAPATVTARSLEDALPKRGMFMLQEPSTLIHRSGDGSLVHTPIQQDGAGFFIIRPRWTMVSGRHFDSVHELAAALADEGLTQRLVRIDPAVVPGTSPGIEPSVSGTAAPQPPDLALADPPRITSPYEIPASARADLEGAAFGDKDSLLDDSVGVVIVNSSYNTFKALRKQLLEAAVRFYADLRLPTRPSIAPLEQALPTQAFIERLFEEFRGLVIGESHADTGSKQWLIDNMQTLANKGVKTLYSEHLLTDFHQAALDNFARTSVMPRDLELYLRELDRGHMTDPLQRYTFLNLVKEANRHGIRVQAIDCMASYRQAGMKSADPLARQKMMNFFAHSVIEADQAARGPHNWVALVGNSHSNTFEGVAGVSELEGAVGLRAEDVAEGKSGGIEPDPGKSLSDEMGKNAAKVRGDLRLQVETPWYARSTSEIEQLISRPGMYTLKKELRETFLVHRNRDNAIVRTHIHFESGRVYIERPAWPTVHEKRFDSIEALLKALDERGMKLAGWSKPF
ncbi:membrane-targeted effector domain-containing toxin [Pseudomonas migulae]|uniref:membrane-targeted effector domain-containing toxin n=1 Tax=Pseudomonas migulae TaxID=78543 RepID=UPI003711B622